MDSRFEKKVKQAIFVISVGETVAKFLLNTNRVVKAIQLAEECLIVLNNTVLRDNTKIFYSFYLGIGSIFFEAYPYIYDYTRAIEWGEKLLDITAHVFGEFCDAVGSIAMRLAVFHKRQSRYGKAKELLERALRIKQETGNRDDEATCYGHLGLLFQRLSQYHNFKKYVEKALEIRQEISDKQGIATCYGNLGVIFRELGQYDKAIEYIHKSLLIRKQTGDRRGEATDYANLGKVFSSAGEYAAAGINCLQKALAIEKEIGHREGEAHCYLELAIFFSQSDQHIKAVQYVKKSLSILTETCSSREDESTC